MQAFLLQSRKCMKHLWMYTYPGIIEIQNLNNMQHISLWNTLFPPSIPYFLGCTLLTLPKAKWKSQLPFNPAAAAASTLYKTYYKSYSRSRLRVFKEILLLFPFISLSNLLFENSSQC